MSSPEGEYLVEAILDHRVVRRGKRKIRQLQYFIKWDGYSDEENTWESVYNVHAEDLVAAYWADKGGPEALEALRKGKPRSSRTKANKRVKTAQSSSTVLVATAADAEQHVGEEQAAENLDTGEQGVREQEVGKQDTGNQETREPSVEEPESAAQSAEVRDAEVQDAEVQDAEVQDTGKPDTEEQGIGEQETEQLAAGEQDSGEKAAERQTAVQQDNTNEYEDEDEDEIMDEASNSAEVDKNDEIIIVDDVEDDFGLPGEGLDVETSKMDLDNDSESDKEAQTEHGNTKGEDSSAYEEDAADSEGSASTDEYREVIKVTKRRRTRKATQEYDEEDEESNEANISISDHSVSHQGDENVDRSNSNNKVIENEDMESYSIGSIFDGPLSDLSDHDHFPMAKAKGFEGSSMPNEDVIVSHSFPSDASLDWEEAVEQVEHVLKPSSVSKETENHVILRWKQDNVLSLHRLRVIHDKCPLKLIQFYEKKLFTDTS